MKQNNEAEFVSLPAYPETLADQTAKFFSKYLFYKTESRGVRTYTCSACGTVFTAGKNVLRRTETRELSELDLSEHGDDCRCPACKEICRVINVKRRKISNLSQNKYLALFLPVSSDDIWVRCIEISRRYADTQNKVKIPETEYRELERYHMYRGGCDFYDKYSYGLAYGEFHKMKIYRDAFLWNHGLYTEKYPYYALYYTSDGTLVANPDHTFLKYSGWEHYEGAHGYNLPYMKYLAWYCRHPQLEMLAKMGHFNVIDEMCLRNTDNRAILNWNGKGPKELYGLDGNEYREFMRRKTFGGPDLELLKAYKALKRRGVKAFEAAASLCKFCDSTAYSCSQSKGLRREFLATCKKHKADPLQVMRYLERFHASTRGGCHCFPGLSMPAVYSMWSDYVAMSEYVNVSKAATKATQLGKKKIRPEKVDLMPKDLKAAHDKLITVRDTKRRLERLSEIQKDAVRRSAEHPKVNEILSQIKELYEYSSEDYIIRVPASVADIIVEGEVLGHCVGTHGSGDRYLERIERKESYILFLRRASAPDAPWYTLEAEPNGTLRQKRTKGDRQDSGLELAMPFLKEWQNEVSARITEKERELAKKSKSARLAEYAEMRRKSLKIARGALAGHLLADVLEADLIENLA